MKNLIILLAFAFVSVIAPNSLFAASIAADIVITPDNTSDFFAGLAGGNGDGTNRAIDWAIGNTVPYSTVGNDLVFSTTTGDYLSSSSWQERMRITNSGDIGIGTSEPLAALHIVQGSGIALSLRNASDDDNVTQQFCNGSICSYIELDTSNNLWLGPSESAKDDLVMQVQVT